MFKIGKNKISDNSRCYFIADIGANHDGSLDKAIELINQVSLNGGSAAKFKHFSASTIVSKYGFSKIGMQSHQSKWKKTVYQTYQDASINLEWTSRLKKECDKCGIDFLTSPYSMELVDLVDKYIPAYKIGSGDINWKQIVQHIAKKNKPVILATGASTLKDVSNAIGWIKKYNKRIAVLQCNTNYTGSKDNFKFINLNFLKTLKTRFKNIQIGLSDHTPGDVTVLGAISLGAKIIEKHFTLDNSLDGPDHKFAMNPKTWKKMIERSRELELALGDGNKKIELNEKKTFYLQRRSIRALRDIDKNSRINIETDLISLRPAEKNAIDLNEISKLNNKKAKVKILKGQSIKWKMIV